MKPPTAFELTVSEVGNALELELRRSINPNAADRCRMLWKEIKEWARIGQAIKDGKIACCCGCNSFWYSENDTHDFDAGDLNGSNQ